MAVYPFILSFSTTDPPDQLLVEYKLRLRGCDHETLHKTEWTKARLEPRTDDPNTFDLKLLRSKSREMSVGRYVKWKIRLRGQQKWWPRTRKSPYWINLHKWLYAIPPLTALRGWLPVQAVGQEFLVRDNDDQMIVPGAARVGNYSIRVDF